MELDQHFLHLRRRNVIQSIKDLTDSRSCLCNAVPKIKQIGNTSEEAKEIEENIEALRVGIDETITLCAHLADELRKQMEDPHASPVPITNSDNSKKSLTPYQKMLVREGATGIAKEGIPKYETKTEQRLPRIAPFNLTARKQKARHSDKTYKIPR